MRWLAYAGFCVIALVLGTLVREDSRFIIPTIIWCAVLIWGVSRGYI